MFQQVYHPLLVAAASKAGGYFLLIRRPSPLCLFRRLFWARMDHMVNIRLHGTLWNGLYLRLLLGEGYRNCAVLFSYLDARSCV